MELRRPFVLRHKITGALKHTTGLSAEEAGLWEVMLTDGTPAARRAVEMEEASRRVPTGRKGRIAKAVPVASRRTPRTGF